jgi:NAD(P)-dependent dehydrogenase (short-subunit alcohol dehydrogenase family)
MGEAVFSATGSGGRLENRKILITGAGSGIGRASAQLFAREGARLSLADIDFAQVHAVSQECAAQPFVFDLADSLAIGGMVEAAAAALGGLDGVVNCAGIGQNCPLGELDFALWSRVLAVNLTAPYAICRAALPFLRAREASTIVNVASGQGLLPNAPNITAYAATKGGLVSFSRALAAELAPRIRVNTVCPGVTNTPMVAHLFSDYEDPSAAPFVAQYALRRVAEPIEIARAILFLTSYESSYVTGAALAVDGGRTFH